MDSKNMVAFNSSEIDTIANVIYEISSERNLKALKYALDKERIGQYCILGKKEWKVCIQKDRNKWKVSFVERDKDVSPVLYDDVNDACLELIRRVTPKHKTRKVMSNYLKQVGYEPAIEMRDIKAKLVAY